MVEKPYKILSRMKHVLQLFWHINTDTLTLLYDNVTVQLCLHSLSILGHMESVYLITTWDVFFVSVL